MLNRNRFRLAKKVVEVMINNSKAVRFAVDGIVADVDSGMWKDTDELIPLIGKEGTIGAVRARPDWKTDPVILNHLIASVQGRMVHFSLLEHAQINPLEMSADQLATLMAMTDGQQRQILLAMVGKEKAEAHWKAEDEEMEGLLNEFKEHQANKGSVEF